MVGQQRHAKPQILRFQTNRPSEALRQLGTAAAAGGRPGHRLAWAWKDLIFKDLIPHLSGEGC